MIVPLVTRHIDYLSQLKESGKVDHDRLCKTLGHPNVALLLGSSPIGQESGPIHIT